MSNEAQQLQTPDTFNRGALRMTVSIIREINPQLALLVQNQMSAPINPQPDASPNVRDLFNISLPPLSVRHIVEALQVKGSQPKADPGTQMMVKALIIDWVKYANLLIAQENDKD